MAHKDHDKLAQKKRVAEVKKTRSAHKKTLERAEKPYSNLAIFFLLLKFSLRTLVFRRTGNLIDKLRHKNDKEIIYNILEQQSVSVHDAVLSPYPVYPVSAYDADIANKTIDKLDNTHDGDFSADLTLINFVVMALAGVVVPTIIGASSPARALCESGYTWLVFIILFSIIATAGTRMACTDPKKLNADFRSSEMKKPRINVVVDNERVLGSPVTDKQQLAHEMCVAVIDNDYTGIAHTLDCEPNYTSTMNAFKDADLKDQEPIVPVIAALPLINLRKLHAGTDDSAPVELQDEKEKLYWQVHDRAMAQLQSFVVTTPEFLGNNYGNVRLAHLLNIFSLEALYETREYIKAYETSYNELNSSAYDVDKGDSAVNNSIVDAVFEAHKEAL